MARIQTKPFERLYSRAQCDAAALAMVDDGYTSRDVVNRARDGELALNGEPVGPFVIAPEYVRRLASDLKKERLGKKASPLGGLPARDATEALRVRLVNLADAELRYLERQKNGVRDLARMRDVIRCVKEAASIMPPKETQHRPGQSIENGAMPGANRPAGEATRGRGNTGALLAAMRGTRSNPSGEDRDED